MNQYNKAIELYNNGFSLRKIEEQKNVDIFKRSAGNKRKLNGKASSISFAGNIQVKKISNYLYKDATIFLKRKQQKMPS